MYDYEIFISQLNKYGIYTIKDYSDKTLDCDYNFELAFKMELFLNFSHIICPSTCNIPFNFSVAQILIILV